MHWHRGSSLKRRAILFFPVLLAIAVSPFLFRVRHISCATQFGPCPANLADFLTQVRGKLLFSSVSAEVERLLASQIDVKSLTLSRRLPDQVTVNLTLREPLGLIGAASGSVYILIDKDGTAYKQVTIPSLPILIVDHLPGEGGQLSSLQYQSLQALVVLQALSSHLITGSLNDTSLQTDVGGTTVLVSVAKPVSSWEPALKLILNRSRSTAKPPKMVDLRFADPVISY